jgi:hypothetical protein
MKMIAQILSWISLVVLIAPSVLFLAGKMSSLDQVKWVMLLATILWFVTAPLWMWKEND